jgi:hypothetical protein
MHVMTVKIAKRLLEKAMLSSTWSSIKSFHVGTIITIAYVSMFFAESPVASDLSSTGILQMRPMLNFVWIGRS